jgi:hypothetical protein
MGTGVPSEVPETVPAQEDDSLRPGRDSGARPEGRI